MACHTWITEAHGDNPLKDIALKLEGTNFKIDEQCSTRLQIWAVYVPSEITTYWSGVRLLATWANRNARTIRIDITSDEPMLRVNNHCDRSAKDLKKVFPPIA